VVAPKGDSSPGDDTEDEADQSEQLKLLRENNELLKKLVKKLCPKRSPGGYLCSGYQLFLRENRQASHPHAPTPTSHPHPVLSMSG
jgi:hypothetical protein